MVLRVQDITGSVKSVWPVGKHALNSMGIMRWRPINI